MSEVQKNMWPGWETVRLIGRGSFGSVYEIQRSIQGMVEHAALKVISIPKDASEIRELRAEGYDNESLTQYFMDSREKIESEYAMMAVLKGHANVVYCDDILTVQHDDGFGWDIYIRMELLTPLKAGLGDSVSDAQVIKLGLDICDALKFCEELNIVHRDIKPENIFISRSGNFKLGDFGIAKTMEGTTGGTKTGTFDYMAPEVYNNQPYHTQADLYSLGLVLYWLLNNRTSPFLPLHGKKPTPSEKALARDRRFSGEAIPAPAQGSLELQRIVLKACAFDPKDRYHSAAAMLADLRALAGGVAPVPPVSNGDGATGEEIATVIQPRENLDEGTVASDFKPKRDADLTEDTVGTVFNPKRDADISGGTVAPTFKPKSELKPEDPPAAPAKKKGGKFILIGLGILLLVFLLLRSCGGAKSTDNPTTPATEQPSNTQGDIMPEQLEWSGWMDQLPSGVTAEQYEIEEKTLYSSRTQEIASSTEQDTMEGWEHFDTVRANGGYGSWSSWSANKVESSSTREVDKETRYRYRDKQITTGSSSNKDGWTLYDTTHSWGGYGSWSSWSTNAVSGSDSRKVETKTQYHYRNIYYSTEYTGWSDWSSWGDSAVTETEFVDVETQTAYHYYYYTCSNCGKRLPGQNLCYSWDGGCGKSGTGTNYTKIRLTTSYSSTKDYGGCGMNYLVYNGSKVFAYTSTSSKHYRAPITQYRYRTRSTQQIAYYGSWSNWGDTPYYNSSTLQVETRTAYRYCDRSKVATYHFYRWGDWSDWSANQVSATNDREVENKTFYRYRDQVTSTTYYFRRWTDWTPYTEDPVIPSETVEVKTQIQYRYKLKES